MNSGPTGSYDKDKPLNLGENRIKYDLQLGYTHGIGRAFNIELAGDVMWLFAFKGVADF